MKRDLVAACDALEDLIDKCTSLGSYDIRGNYLGTVNLTQKCSIGNLSRYAMVLSAMLLAIQAVRPNE